MKRYIRNSTIADWTRLRKRKGSAGPANSRGGLVKFGNGKRYDLGNGWWIQFCTGVVRIDINTGKVDTYCNIYVTRDSKYAEEDVHDSYEWTGLTADEAEEVYRLCRNATYEELVDAICVTWSWKK